MSAESRVTAENQRVDVVYILGFQDDYSELRYSLRSLRFFPHRNVWIVGAPPPDWCVGVNHLSTEQLPIEGSGTQKYKNRKYNQRLNLLSACEHEDVAEEFVFMNDDFMFVKDLTNMGGTLPPPPRTGTFLDQFGNMDPNAGPDQKLYYWMRDHLGIDDPIYVPEHVPMIVGKRQLELAMRAAWHIEGFPVSPLWANVAGIETYLGEDFLLKKKRHHESWPERHWAVSTVEWTFYDWPVGQRLRELHREPSPYENEDL